MNKNWKKNIRDLILIFFISCCIFPQIIHASSDDKVSYNLTRNFGVGLGDNLFGEFTLKAKGDSSITHLTLYFNEEEVASSETNELKFSFVTVCYSTGDMNITLRGWDAQGNVFEYSHMYNFLEPYINTLIIILVVLLVLISIIIKYRKPIYARLTIKHSRKESKEKSSSDDEISKEKKEEYLKDIKIDKI